MVTSPLFSISSGFMLKFVIAYIFQAFSELKKLKIFKIIFDLIYKYQIPFGYSNKIKRKQQYFVGTRYFDTRREFRCSCQSVIRFMFSSVTVLLWIYDFNATNTPTTCFFHKKRTHKFRKY